jgi:hypothetical protein
VVPVLRKGGVAPFEEQQSPYETPLNPRPPRPLELYRTLTVP